MADVEVGMAFDPSEVSGVRRAFKKIPKVVNKAMRKVAAEEGRRVIQETSKVVPVRTGLLKRSSFIGRAKGGAQGTEITVGYKVVKIRKGAKKVFDYAPIVEARQGYFARGYKMARRGRATRIARRLKEEINKAL